MPTVGIQLKQKEPTKTFMMIIYDDFKLKKIFGPSLVFYPQPIGEWFNLSHEQIGQSPPSFSCYFNLGVEYDTRAKYLFSMVHTKYFSILRVNQPHCDPKRHCPSRGQHRVMSVRAHTT